VNCWKNRKKKRRFVVFKQKNTIRIEKTKETFRLIDKRNHSYVSGSYQKKTSQLIVFCNIHQKEHITTFSNYSRSRTGCPCCGKEQVSQKLKNRQFSNETLEKMKSSALERPLRGGKPKNWRKEKKYRDWRRDVLKEAGHKCAITGKTDNLAVHHIYNAKHFEQFTYKVENGLVLHREIHDVFHKTYCYGNNTPDQFLTFLSTGSLGDIASQSSETRARIKELQERLNKLSLFESKVL
jgi:hypothetical protein